MTILARLGVILGINTAEFKAGLDDATKNTKLFEANARKSLKNAEKASAELGATMGKLSLAVGIASLAIGKILQRSDEIADMASAFDASIGSIVGMSKALDMSGGKAENVATLLTKLTVSADGAREGSDKLRKAFQQIGVSASEVQNLNPDELFERVAEQLAKIEDPVERNAKAFELLGKSAKGIDWKKYVSEYKQVSDPDLTAAIQTSAEAWDNIQKAVSSAYYFMVKMVQPLAALLNDFLTLADRYKEFKEEGGTINFDPNNPMGEGIEFKGTGKPTPKPSAPKKAVPAGGYKVGSEKEIKQAQDRAKASGAFNARVMELQKIEELIKREGELIGLSELEQEIKKNAYKLEDENAKMQMDLQRQIDEERLKGIDADKLKIKMLEDQQKAYEALIVVTKQQSEEAIRANENRVRSQQILTNSEKQGFDTMVGNFEALGKQSKKAFDAWKAFSIVQTIIDTYSGAQKAFTSMAGIPFVGPALGMVAAGAAIAAGMARVSAIRSMQYQGRAKGGTITKDTPYMVGENGPELVVPNHGGTVIPNGTLQSAMMGQPQVVYNGPYIANLSAIDTQSGTEFLARNKTAVWAANLSAQRSVPTSR